LVAAERDGLAVPVNHPRVLSGAPIEVHLRRGAESVLVLQRFHSVELQSVSFEGDLIRSGKTPVFRVLASPFEGNHLEVEDLENTAAKSLYRYSCSPLGTRSGP